MKNEELEYCLVRNVKEPCRAHPQDAGIDFFVPIDLTVQDMQEKNPLVSSSYPRYITEDGSNIVEAIVLKPGQRVLIPSGVKMKVPDGYMLMYDNKSGVASKKGLVIGAKIVDIGYEGECHLNLINTSNETTSINAGDKICQGILVKIGFHLPKRVENEAELYGDSHSARGDGGFGSTDKQEKMCVDEHIYEDKECCGCSDCSNGYEWFDGQFINFTIFDIYNPDDTSKDRMLTVRLDQIEAISSSPKSEFSTLYLKSGASFAVYGTYNDLRKAIATHS